MTHLVGHRQKDCHLVGGRGDAAFPCAYHITKNEGELLFTSRPGVPEHAVPQPGIRPGATKPPAPLIPWAPRERQGRAGVAAL